MNRWIAPAGVSIILVALYFFLPRFTPHTIEVRFYNGDAYIHVEQDDTLIFTSRGAPTSVVFKDNAAPCVGFEHGAKIHQCKIQPASGLYRFNCEGCNDPGIAVGSSVSPQ